MQNTVLALKGSQASGEDGRVDRQCGIELYESMGLGRSGRSQGMSLKKSPHELSLQEVVQATEQGRLFQAERAS